MKFKITHNFYSFDFKFTCTASHRSPLRGLGLFLIHGYKQVAPMGLGSVPNSWLQTGRPLRGLGLFLIHTCKKVEPTGLWVLFLIHICKQVAFAGLTKPVIL